MILLMCSPLSEREEEEERLSSVRVAGYQTQKFSTAIEPSLRKSNRTDRLRSGSFFGYGFVFWLTLTFTK